MLALILTLLLCVQVSSFCYMNEVGGIQKYMLLHSKPTTLILVNHFIDKYSKRTGVSVEKIKSCIQKKKTKQKTNLRG
jgi:hypothetical protein